MTLAATVEVHRGAFTLDVRLAAADGEVVAVVGPNGAGKSTLLRAVAGLVDLDRGAVELDGVTLSRPGLTVPPDRRRIGLLGQDPMLFPHLSALENVAFGPRAAGVPKATARQRAAELLAAVDVAEHAARRPAALSGGQQQRVALARALAADPRLILLDEPLAALDVHTAPEIRQLLRATLRRTGLTSVLVTHEVLDAIVIADRLMVLDAGRVVADGPPAAVLGAPANAFVASLAGVNLVLGTMRSGAVLPAAGAPVAGLAEAPIPDGSPAAAVFAPTAVAVYPEQPHGSPRNNWPAIVVAVEPGRSTVRVRLSGPPDVLADLTPGAVAELDLTPGRVVWVSVKATEVALYAR